MSTPRELREQAARLLAEAEQAEGREFVRGLFAPGQDDHQFPGTRTVPSTRPERPTSTNVREFFASDDTATTQEK